MTLRDRAERSEGRRRERARPARSLAGSLVLVLAVLPACSAVVSPDPSRLGGSDGGPGGADAPSGVDAPGGLDTPGGCPASEIVCGGRCVAPATDPNHCGRCNNPCPMGIACVAGTCECPPGAPGCSPTTGPIGNPDDCGPAHAVCGTGQVCVLGMCACRPRLTPVGAECVDLTSDPNNCGRPGMRCPDVCRDGSCAGGCGDGLTECDGACVALNRDPLNCGECGRACPGNAMCVNRDCREVIPAPGCTSCPCTSCGAACCTLPRLEVPYCLNADACP